MKDKLTDKQLCFDGVVNGPLKNATCSGDSGGPVYWNSGTSNVQIGITSFGFEQCGLTTETFVSVFTDIHDYQAWIDDVIASAVSPMYEIQVQNGQRTLIDNTQQSTTETAAFSNGSSSGGSLSVISLLGLLFISFMRQCSKVHSGQSSNRLRSQN